MNDPRVIVTGGSGFIGTNLVELYLAQGCVVESWDIEPPRKPDHAAVWRRIDVDDRSLVARSLGHLAPTHVVHLAARTDLRGSSLSEYETNVRGTENVLGAVEGVPTVRHVVVASSRLVCRLGYSPSRDDDYAPDSHYGESKAQMEDLVRTSRVSTQWTIVRPTSIWGPWFDTPYRDFFLAVARGRYIHPRGIAIPKSFGFVGNTVHQLRELGRADQARVAGRTFYVADYAPLDVLDFANQIRRALDLSDVRSSHVAVLGAAATVGDVLRRLGVSEPPLTRFRLQNLLTPMVYDIAPLREVVGPLPYTQAEGIELTIAWMRRQELV